MFRIAKPALAAVLLALSGMSAFAADIVEPPVVEAPLPARRVSAAGIFAATRLSLGGVPRRRLHHLRRDLLRRCRSRHGSFDFGDLDGAFSLGGGVGYQITNYLRTDLTADYWFNSDFNGQTSGTCGGAPCVSSDTSSWSAWLLLANAYADLGTYYGFTPYVGAGIGGAHVNWDDLHNTIDGVTTVHEGSDELALRLGADGRHLLLPHRQPEARRRLPLQPHQWRAHVRAGAGHRSALAPASTMASTCTRRAPACATSSAAIPGAACRRSPTSRSRRSTNSPDAKARNLRPPGTPPGGFRLSAALHSRPSKKTGNRLLSLTAT